MFPNFVKNYSYKFKAFQKPISWVVAELITLLPVHQLPLDILKGQVWFGYVRLGWVRLDQVL